MRVIHSVTELQGFNQGPVAGITLIDLGQAFLSRGVTVASVLYNATSGKSATVTAITETTLQAGSLWFEYGDFYWVTLPVAWDIQNSDGPIVDIECRRCGFSYPADELTDGLCSECIDDDQESM